MTWPWDNASIKHENITFKQKLLNGKNCNALNILLPDTIPTLYTYRSMNLQSYK